MEVKNLPQAALYQLWETQQEEIKKLAKLLIEGRNIVNEQAAEIERLKKSLPGGQQG